jgi:hypothetical protein
MYNQSEFLDASGNLNHEAVRAHFLRTGKLEGLKKDMCVYVSDGPRWERVRLRRRLPGDVWLAQYLERGLGARKTVVAIANFGGVSAE